MSFSSSPPPSRPPPPAPRPAPPVPPRPTAILSDHPYTILSGAIRIDSNSVAARTLIISTHGAYGGTSFALPGWTHVMFCTPKDSALRANLTDAIDGKISGVGMPDGSRSCAEFNLTYFEGDPSIAAIRTSLRGNMTFDVLVLAPGAVVLLSALIAWLKSRNLKYPRLQGLFCRVDASGTSPSYSFVGKTSPSTDVAHTSRLNAQSVANELKAKLGAGKT